jgi:hypothetical protein
MVRQVDLDAAIVPGRSAAGFRLGENLGSIEAELPNLTDWVPERQQLVEALAATEGWLRAKTHSAQGDLRGTLLAFKGGAVELQFSPQDILCEIRLADGYRGKVLNDIGIGDRLASVSARCSLSFDDGDEMYYPEAGAASGGLGFIAAAPQDEEVDRKILGISVHDWQLLRGERIG